MENEEIEICAQKTHNLYDNHLFTLNLISLLFYYVFKLISNRNTKIEILS